MHLNLKSTKNRQSPTRLICLNKHCAGICTLFLANLYNFIYQFAKIPTRLIQRILLDNIKEGFGGQIRALPGIPFPSHVLTLSSLLRSSERAFRLFVFEEEFGGQTWAVSRWIDYTSARYGPGLPLKLNQFPHGD